LHLFNGDWQNLLADPLYSLSLSFSNQSSTTETTIIFDWDDTLLSSSWLAQNGLRLDEPSLVPHEARVQLDVLQDSVISLLQRAMTFGTCIIITNAETGWVELSCKKFLPRVQPLISKLRVLSARSTFESRFPDSPSDWKVQAFSQEIHAAYAGRKGEQRRNLISFGDSIHERAAIHKVTQLMVAQNSSKTGNDAVKINVKSVKFVERPTLEQLKRQIDLVTNCFGEVVGHAGNLDLMLTISLLYN